MAVNVRHHTFSAPAWHELTHALISRSTLVRFVGPREEDDVVVWPEGVISIGDNAVLARCKTLDHEQFVLRIEYGGTERPTAMSVGADDWTRATCESASGVRDEFQDAD